MNKDYAPAKAAPLATLKRMALNLAAIAAVTTIFGAKAVSAQYERLAAEKATIALIETQTSDHPVTF